MSDGSDGYITFCAQAILISVLRKFWRTVIISTKKKKKKKTTLEFFKKEQKTHSNLLIYYNYNENSQLRQLTAFYFSCNNCYINAQIL